ncbi:MAG: phosphatase PAP2 family protein [Bacteroidota bacterium]|nr:phosphatase PAP2 family protein [Bacteroidota bacterium]
MKQPALSRTMIVLTIIITSFSGIHAQKKTTSSFDSIPSFRTDSAVTFNYDVLNLHTIGSGFRDGGRVYTSPIRWTGTDWLKVAVLGGAAVAVHQLDEPINNMIHRNSSPFMKGFSSSFEPFGNSLYVIPALLGTYFYAHATGKEELSGLTITAGKAVIIANAIATWSKVLAHRHRPYEGTPSKPNQWDGPRADFKNVSFFSSHTVTAFSLATVIASTYSDQKWVPYACYSMASLVGISRITGKDHWATDVFVGAVVGYGVGKLVYKLNRSKKIKLVVGL